MNKKAAEAAGYEFSGIYNWNHEEVKARAVKLRKEGNKAVVVYSPGSKYSRSGSGGGWSVYWIESEDNKNARLLQSAKNRLGVALVEHKRIIDQLSAKMVEIEKLQAEVDERSK